MTPLRKFFYDHPNAVPDTGINLKNGTPVLRGFRPFQPSRWKTPKLTQIWELTPYPMPAPAFIPPSPPAKIDKPPGFLTPKAVAISVVNETCDAWGIEQYRLIGELRFAEVVRVRQAAMAIIRRITSLSFPRIGEFFGGRDHSTVIHANRKMLPHIAALNQELTEWSTPAEWVWALKARLEA